MVTFTQSQSQKGHKEAMRWAGIQKFSFWVPFGVSFVDESTHHSFLFLHT